MKREVAGKGRLKGDDVQVRNHAKVAEISGTDPITEMKGGYSDEQVRERDHQPVPFCVSVDLRRKSAHLLCERFHRNGEEDGIEVRPPLPRQRRDIGALQAVLQLYHRNRRDDDLSLSVRLFEFQQQIADRFGVALGGDQHTGVED